MTATIEEMRKRLYSTKNIISAGGFISTAVPFMATMYAVAKTGEFALLCLNLPVLAGVGWLVQTFNHSVQEEIQKLENVVDGAITEKKPTIHIDKSA